MMAAPEGFIATLPMGPGMDPVMAVATPEETMAPYGVLEPPMMAAPEGFIATLAMGPGMDPVTAVATPEETRAA
jgi:hypothetical protein